MKKLYLLLTLLLLSVATCFAQTSSSDIEINDNGTDEVDRSLESKVTATLNHDAQTVELCFNRSIGTVTIMIEGAGGVITETCDTNSQRTKTIHIPLHSGSYTVVISGNTYHGEGQFDLPHHSVY